MKIPDFILRFAGRKIADKLDLKETKDMDNTKSWYKSKTIWSGVVAALIGVYNAISSVQGLPPIPDWIFTILGAIGVYSRVTADSKIS